MRIKGIEHIGIAVGDIEESRSFYTRGLNLEETDIETIGERGVKVCFLNIPNSKIELLEPLSEDSPVHKFLKNRGEGIHHICFGVDNLEGILKRLKKMDYRLIHEDPVRGAGGAKVAFVHPDSTSGVLIELEEKD